MRELAGTPSINCHFHGKSRLGSLLTSFATWLFIAALAADASNLDDVLSSAVVLHDDDEVVCSTVDLSASALASNYTGKRQTNGVSSIHQSSRAVHPIVRVIVDQDSPSLPANNLQTPSKILVFLRDRPMVSADLRPPSGLLHLLFHSLLI